MSPNCIFRSACEFHRQHDCLCIHPPPQSHVCFILEPAGIELDSFFTTFLIYAPRQSDRPPMLHEPH